MHNPFLHLSLYYGMSCGASCSYIYIATATINDPYTFAVNAVLHNKTNNEFITFEILFPCQLSHYSYTSLVIFVVFMQLYICYLWLYNSFNMTMHHKK